MCKLGTIKIACFRLHDKFPRFFKKLETSISEFISQRATLFNCAAKLLYFCWECCFDCVVCWQKTFASDGAREQNRPLQVVRQRLLGRQSSPGARPGVGRGGRHHHSAHQDLPHWSVIKTFSYLPLWAHMQLLRESIKANHNQSCKTYKNKL